MLSLRGPRRRRDEQGVVAIAVALITCFMVLPMGALAVDIGVQRIARTDMQSVADVVALDVARKLDGAKTMAQWSAASPTIQAIAEGSLSRNGSAVGNGATVEAKLGTLDPATGDFTELPSSSSAVPNAVRVSASTSVNFVMMGGSGGTTRTAVAQAQTAGCFQLGSFVASLDPSASALFKDLLTPLVGSSTLTAVGYNGLASANLSLLDLISTDYIGVGTVDELLALNDLTVADLYRASATVLSAEGLVAEANVFNIAATSVVAPITIQAGDLFGLTTANAAALETKFNALDLLLGAAFLANGTNALNLANLQTGLSSVAVTSSSLKIIERAQRACNQDEAKTAQVDLVSSIKATISNSPIINLPGAQLRLVDSADNNSNDLNMGLNVQLAGARGFLTDLSCNPDTFDIDVWSDLATLNLNGTVGLKGDVYVTLLGVSNVKVPVRMQLSVAAATSNPASGPTHTQLQYPPMNYGDFKQMGSGNHALPYVTVSIVPGSIQVIGNVTVTILGIPVVVPTGDVVTAVSSLVSPLVAGLGGPSGRIGAVLNPLVDKINTIVGQLSTGLGLNVGGADVYGLPTPNCQAPVLRG